MQIAVRAVGLNFRDILNVLGMYPGDPGAPGADCAGTVEAVGPCVNGIAPGAPCENSSHSPILMLVGDFSCLVDLLAGDAVFGLAPGCLGPTVLVPTSLVVPMPSNISYEAAATTPTVYTTVLIAFQNVRNMGPGTALMVHAGTGGVGLAAIQVASALGCCVSASASSPAKRLQLRRMGLSTISDSRASSFTESLNTVHSQGIDVILNSLTSPGKQHHIACLDLQFPAHRIFAYSLFRHDRG